MYKNVLLTNHPLMDFILSHIFSVILFSENGITLKQNQRLERKNLKTNPVIALYPKGLPVQKSNCSWKKYRKRQFPCLNTTAHSIQLLAKTANYIFNHPDILKKPSLSHSIGSEFASISGLQLDYCLENLENHHYPIETYATFLETCFEVIKLKNKQPNLNTGWVRNLNDSIDIVYNKLSCSENLDLANTLELSKIANAVQRLVYEIPNHPSARELTSKIALELLYRRNSLGLFQRDRNNQKTAPLSWQFHCIGSLLLSYSIYPINKILEETFSVFNRLYQLSWNPILNLFSFNRNLHIRYTPLEIAAIIKALYLLSSWVYGEEQLKQLNQILYSSYFPVLSEDFFINYHQSIHIVYNRFMNTMEFLHETNIHKHNNKIYKVYKAPVFPSTIQIIYSKNALKKLEIQWSNNSPLYIQYPLELCICLLDCLEMHYQNRGQNNNKENTDPEWLNLILSILHQQD